MKRKAMRLVIIGAFAVFGGGACSYADDQDTVQVEATQPALTDEYRLPVSINEVMVALVNDAADPIWIAAWRAPETDREWRALERRAYQLQLAGSLIAYPGTGMLDEQWVAESAWSQWSHQLRATGADAVAAVQNRDLGAIGSIGGQLVEVCEGCHRDFKLPMPTEGRFGELSPAPGDTDE